MNRKWVALALIGWSAAFARAAATAPETIEESLAATGIEWHEWSQATFDQAKREHRLVLLHLGAGWCHWCHVMEHETYRDAAVDRLLKEHFVAIHVDQDSRPDLSNRYEEYGWPATILFDENGKELVKMRGYIPPERMRGLLQATIDDPTPGPSVTSAPKIEYNDSPALATWLRQSLEKRLADTYDTKNAGWGTMHKHLDADAIEYKITRSRNGDKEAARRARETLAASRKLIDPVWGGIYQYSTDGDWEHPHFEKIMQYQADALRIYAMAYARWHDPVDLAAAEAIRKFLIGFLRTPEGAFYTSQDADVIPGEHSGGYFVLDDAGRRKVGVPRIDKHVYARENGWAIRGLASLYAVTGETKYLDEARAAAEWISANRALKDRGFRHDERDVAGPFLGDTLAMGQAYLTLHQVTGDRRYLTAAEESAAFIDNHLRDAAAGYVTAEKTDVLQFDENVGVARFANLLFQYTGKREYQQIASHAMLYIATPAVASEHSAAPALIAGSEFGIDPTHITIVGAMGDARAEALFKTAIAAVLPYARIEWYDRSQGAPRDDVVFPPLKRPAAFFCTNGACSMPAYEPDILRKLIAERTGVAE